MVRKQDRERWNDWGIGLLLQGDLKGAEYAFHRVTEAEPGYADGWLNVARALIQEGETDAARPFVEKALALSPELARGLLLPGHDPEGRWRLRRRARRVWREARRQYPRDRVVLESDRAASCFCSAATRRPSARCEQALAVDPEDLQAHYNLMLCYRGLGQTDKAEREEKLFRRFKADEASQALTAKPRLLSPEDNNERQPIHDHVCWPCSCGCRHAPAAGGN